MNFFLIKGYNVSGVSFFSKFVTLLLLLDNVLVIYGTEATSISSILQLICILVYFVFLGGFHNLHKRIVNVPKFINCYFFYLILLTFTISTILPIGYLKIILWYIVFFNVIDYRYLLKSYQAMVVVVIAFFYIQEITHFLTGVRVLGYIPGLPLRLAASSNDMMGYLEGIATGTRSSSIFSEPAHLAQWLFPMLCIRLFSKEHYNMKRALFICFTLLLTKSGNAMFGLAAVGAYYIYLHTLKNNNVSQRIKGIVLIFAGIVAFSIYSSSSLGSEVMERQETLSVSNEMDKGYATSSFMRIYRGYFIYNDYSFVEKIFGNPSEDAFWKHARNSGIFHLFKENDTYLNTVHRILIFTGIIGAIFILLLVFDLFKKNTPEACALLCAWILFSFISSGFFTGYTSIYFAFIYLSKKHIQKY